MRAERYCVVVARTLNEMTAAERANMMLLVAQALEASQRTPTSLVITCLRRMRLTWRCRSVVAKQDRRVRLSERLSY
jgi:hypothetical protein